MILKFNFSVDAWIKNLEIEADTKAAAMEQLKSMTFEEILDLGAEVKAFEISDIDSEIVAQDIVVEVSDVEYEEDNDDDDVREDDLPTSFKLELTSVYTDDDVGDYISEKIFEKTNTEPKTFNYKIITEEN